MSLPWFALAQLYPLECLPFISKELDIRERAGVCNGLHRAFFVGALGKGTIIIKNPLTDLFLLSLCTFPLFECFTSVVLPHCLKTNRLFVISKDLSEGARKPSRRKEDTDPVNI